MGTPNQMLLAQDQVLFLYIYIYIIFKKKKKTYLHIFDMDLQGLIWVAAWPPEIRLWGVTNKNHQKLAITFLWLIVTTTRMEWIFQQLWHKWRNISTHPSLQRFRRAKRLTIQTSEKNTPPGKPKPALQRKNGPQEKVRRIQCRPLNMWFITFFGLSLAVIIGSVQIPYTNGGF